MLFIFNKSKLITLIKICSEYNLALSALPQVISFLLINLKYWLAYFNSTILTGHDR